MTNKRRWALAVLGFAITIGAPWLMCYLIGGVGMPEWAWLPASMTTIIFMVVGMILCVWELIQLK